MKKFRKILALLLAAAVALSMAGCNAQSAAGDLEKYFDNKADTTKQNAASEPQASAAPQATANPEAGFLDVSAYQGTVLEETPDAGEDYIQETLFVGDSNTVRY